MDIADQCESNLSAFDREAQYLHSMKMQTLHADPMCEYCEENTPHVTDKGTVLKYCDRCIEELQLQHI